MDAVEPTLERLKDAIGWYDRKSLENQRRFKLLKAVQLLAAASIPVVATVGVHPPFPQGSAP